METERKWHQLWLHNHSHQNHCCKTGRSSCLHLCRSSSVCIVFAGTWGRLEESLRPKSWPKKYKLVLTQNFMFKPKQTRITIISNYHSFAHNCLHGQSNEPLQLDILKTHLNSLSSPVCAMRFEEFAQQTSVTWKHIDRESQSFRRGSPEKYCSQSRLLLCNKPGFSE